MFGGGGEAIADVLIHSGFLFLCRLGGSYCRFYNVHGGAIFFVFFGGGAIAGFLSLRGKHFFLEGEAIAEFPIVRGNFFLRGELLQIFQSSGGTFFCFEGDLSPIFSSSGRIFF